MTNIRPIVASASFSMRSSLTLVALLGLAACSGGDSDPAPLCTPGSTTSCVCPGGVVGAQACLPGGGGFGMCECGLPDGGPGSIDLGFMPMDGSVLPADDAGSDPPDAGPVGPEETAGECSDGIDNDRDGRTDCDDLACTVHAFCVSAPENTDVACRNGRDDDRDGLTDCLDSDCARTADCFRPSPEDTDAACRNGFDDDADGLVDCTDTDCRTLMECDPTAGLTAYWTHPGVMTGLRRDTTEDVFPTYVAHLFNTPLDHPISMRTTCVDIGSTRENPVTLSFNVRFPGYATESLQDVMVPAGGFTSVCLDPVFDLASLYSLTAPTGGRVESTLTLGGTPVASDMLSVRVLPVSDILWWHPFASYSDMTDLSAVFVEPNAPATEALLPSVASRVRFRGSAGPAGYARNAYTRPSVSISVGAYSSELFWAEEGESTVWRIISSSGGDGDVDVSIMTDDQYVEFAAGRPAVRTLWRDQLAGATRTFVAPVAGWYNFVVQNTTDNWVSRTTSWSRTPTGEEVVRDALKAIFDTLRESGMFYTSISGSFFDGTQHVRRVAETLGTGTGNCIDGTVVFASLLELMDLEPVIAYKTGHAFIGVRAQRGSGGRVWYMETTMVGAAATTAWDAYGQGITTYLEAVSSSDPYLDLVAIPDMRARSIVPFSR